MKTIEVVAAVIYDNNNNILITKRKHKMFNGLWEFPGGKIEPNESHQQALIREIKEELEINISVGEFIITIEYDYPDFHLIMHAYKAYIINGNINLSVHSDIKWINNETSKGIEWVPADINIVNKIFSL